MKLKEHTKTMTKKYSMLGSNIFVIAPEPTKDTAIYLDSDTKRNVQQERMKDIFEFEIFAAPESTGLKTGDMVMLDLRGRTPNANYVMAGDKKVLVFTVTVHEVVARVETSGVFSMLKGEA